MALEFQISAGSSLPLYRQIADQVRRAVATGRLKEGDRLPSVRALADLLVINPNTVARAFGELVRDGLAESQQGRGLFVTKRRAVFSHEERARRIRDALDVFLSEARLLDYDADAIQRMIGKEFPDDKPKPNK